MAKKEINYNKDSLAQSLMDALDSSQAMFMYPDTNTFKAVNMPIAKKIVDVLVLHLQDALVTGARIYFPEIGIIEASKVNSNRTVFNFQEGKHKPVKKSWKLKIKTSSQMAEALKSKIKKSK